MPEQREENRPITDLEGRRWERQFQQIYERFYRPVLGFFCKRGFDSDESRDLTQDTFFRIYKGMNGYRGEAKLRTWIFAIAANIYRNRLRDGQTEKRSGREVSLETSLEEGRPVFGRGSVLGRKSQAPDVLEGLLTDERRKLLRDALEELPPRMRRCVLLRLDHDLKYREIAAILRVSVETVKAQLFQARQRLHHSLGEYFGDLEKI